MQVLSLFSPFFVLFFRLLGPRAGQYSPLSSGTPTAAAVYGAGSLPTATCRSGWLLLMGTMLSTATRMPERAHRAWLDWVTIGVALWSDRRPCARAKGRRTPIPAAASPLRSRVDAVCVFGTPFLVAFSASTWALIGGSWGSASSQFDLAHSVALFQASTEREVPIPDDGWATDRS